MHSLLKTAVNFMKMSVRVLATLAIVALSMAALKDRAHALTISAGTGTVVGLPAAVRSSVSGVLPGGNNAFYVIYTTASSSSYSIMFASQTLGTASGGAAPGWSLTTLFSTTTNASNENIAKVLHGTVLSSGKIVIYYYDAALGALRVISGNASDAPVAPVSVATATVANIQVINDNGGDTIKVLYSSQTSISSRYELRLASAAAGSVTTPIGISAVLITTAASDNASGSFYAVKAIDTNQYRVYYYDSIAGALKEVLLNGSDGPIESSRSTLDTGVITDIYATDAGAGESAVTRLIYTAGGDTVRYAVQRRGISGQCWYVQKIDDGSAAGTIVLSGSDPTISYIKSAALRLARGVAGTFFDDFKENITNAQLGIMTLFSNVTKGSILQDGINGATRDRGVYFPSNTNAVATFNWTTLRGKVVNSFGTALPSIAVSDTVVGSAPLVGAASFSGSATLSPGSSSNQAGGITNVSGNYIINVASGSVNTVSASSTPWVFVYQSSMGVVSVTTLTATGSNANGTAADLNASFIAFSSPVINQVSIDGASQRTSTFSVGYMDNASGLTDFSIASLSGLLSNRFTLSMSFRLVPDGVTVQTTTSAVESGSIPLEGLASETTATPSTNTFWARYSSTDTANLPKSYTLVASSRTDVGAIMLGSLASAVNLRPVEINFTSVTAGSINTLPGYTSLSSTGLINTSTMTTIVIKSSFTNIFSAALVQYDNIHLTTSTSYMVAGSSLPGDIPMRDIRIFTGSTVTANVSALGLNTSATWYVRISSAPAGSTLDNGQVVFSQPIIFYPPVITSVLALNSLDTNVVFSSASMRFLINGSGFMTPPGVSTVTFSTSTEINSGTGLPAAPAGKAVYFEVLSSTAMLVDYLFNIRTSTFGLRYHVFYGTVTTLSGGAAPTDSGRYNAALGSVIGSTILVNSSALNSLGGVLVMSSPAITSVDQSTVTNTRQWALTIRGRGLLAGATVTLYATDGSTVLLAVNATAPTGATVGFDASTSAITATVDFRSPIAGGKNFYVGVASNTDVGAPSLESSSNTLRIFSGPLVWCSSMTVAINYPKLNDQIANTIFNSTTSPTIALSGLGLINGSTMTIVNVSSPVLITQTAAMSSTGAFATFTTTSIFKAAAGIYTVNVSSLIGIFGSDTKFWANASTTISITAASITAATLVSHSAAYSSLQFATYTLTGVGLLPNVSYYLNNTAISSDRIGIMSSSGNAADFSSLNLGFDLRGATVTSSGWEIRASAIGVGPLGSTMTLTNANAGSLTISTIPVLGVIPHTVRTNAANGVTINITGAGLALGATGQMIYQGTALATLGTTDYVGITVADTNIHGATITAVNGAGVASGSSGTLTVDLLNAFPSSSWAIQLSTFIQPGFYGGAAPQTKDSNGTSDPSRQAKVGGVSYTSNASTFTVAESSAPDKVTGLTALASGTASVTLRWISPGDDGNVNPLRTGSNFIVYYSSGNSDRGTGCAPCYPLAAVNGTTGMLEAGASNFIFANTWAQHLPYGYADGVKSTATNVNLTAFDSPSSSGTRGLVVSTQTLSIASVTVKTSTSATGTTGNTSIPSGSVIEATLSISAGSTAGNFWFVVRAQDEVGNFSPTNVVYSTTSATIGASAVTVTDTIDPNATTVLSNTDLGGGVSSGGSIPPGALEGSDTMQRTADTNPPADSSGVDLVGPAVDITLGSGKTEFKKAITLTFTLSGAALAEINSKTSNFALVKVAFFNGSRWVLVRESSFDGTTVTAQVTHLTKFGVAIAAPASNLSQVAVYPNPFRPSQAAQLAQGITFDSVPANTTIAIYTLAGDLVKQLKDDNGDGMVAWNAKNENGDDVASGVYFALLKGAGDTKTIKVAVQR